MIGFYIGQKLLTVLQHFFCLHLQSHHFSQFLQMHCLLHWFWVHLKKHSSLHQFALAGSVAGAILGYVIGHYLWWTPSNEFTSIALFFFNSIPGFTETAFFDIQKLYVEYDFWIVFTAGFTPLPYKVITISSGAFNINFIMFLFASIISRGARFFLVAGLIWKFGPQIKSFIDKYFNWLAIAFTVLLIGGFAAIKLLL